jgi:hypothetical protein
MGQKFDLEEYRGGGGSRRSDEDAASVEAPLAPDSRFRDRSTEQGLLLAYRDELAIYRKQMTELDDVDPAEVLQLLSSVAARLREISSDLWDMRSTGAQHLRSRHVDPLRADLEFHFKCHSRRLTSMNLDWEMSRGQ